MKKFSFGIAIPLAIAVLLAVQPGCRGRKQAYVRDGQFMGTISISGAFALYPLTVRWADEFRKEHPKVRIDISAGGAGKGMTDVLSGMVDLAMFSREISEVERSRGAFGVAVAKDAVLPTISTSNPYLPILHERGLRQEEFRMIFVDGNIRCWGELLSLPSKNGINVYTRSDACGAAEVWAKFLGGNQESLKGLGVFGDPGIADAVRQDRFGIGYNNLVFAYDIRSGKLFDGLSVVPIDTNGNGVIDKEEDFYSTLSTVKEAIADGRYPSPPARPLYLVTNQKPTNPVVAAFLEFILTKGQGIVHEAGYINLPSGVISSELERILK